MSNAPKPQDDAKPSSDEVPADPGVPAEADEEATGSPDGGRQQSETAPLKP